MPILSSAEGLLVSKIIAFESPPQLSETVTAPMEVVYNFSVRGNAFTFFT